jgi:hypothetical protein
MSDAPIFTNYETATQHQLREWAEGRPWHNPWSPGATTPFYGDTREGECCPDFSCCRPDMIWNRERRYAFVGADDDTRSQMLFGAIFNLTDPDTTYVSGGFSNE